MSCSTDELSQLSMAASGFVEQEKIVWLALVFAQPSLLEKGCISEQTVGLIGFAGCGFETLVLKQVGVDTRPWAMSLKEGKSVAGLGQLYTVVIADPLSHKLQVSGLIHPIDQHMWIEGADKPHLMSCAGTLLPIKNQPPH